MASVRIDAAFGAGAPLVEVMPVQTRRVLSAIAMFVSALSLQRACTLPWGAATAGDGTTYVFSSIGLSRMRRVEDGGTASARPSEAGADCRWWPVYGDARLCAATTGGETERARLRLAYPLLQVALWLSTVSLLLQVLRVPRDWRVQSAMPALAFALAAAGIMLVRRGAERGLATLQGLEVVFNAAGYRFAFAAAVLGCVSALLLIERSPAPGSK